MSTIEILLHMRQKFNYFQTCNYFQSSYEKVHIVAGYRLSGIGQYLANCRIMVH
jgi:hypothetical protein